MSIDFERAKLLMDTIVAAGQHGPIYQKLAGLAAEELKAMMEKEWPENRAALRAVTPAAGPANGLVQDAEGQMRPVQPARAPDVVADRAPYSGPMDNPNPRVPEAQRPIPEATPSPQEPLTPNEPIERRTL